MWIKSVEGKNFRNYKALSIELDKGINLLYGDNAQGKTNILEIIYICSTSRSHRGSKDKELILFGEEEAHLRLFVYKRKDLHKIDIHYKKNGKKGIAIDGVPVKKASEMFGYLNVVMFSPDDLAVVKNGPAERRRFLDKEICQIDPVYMDDLGKYNKILDHRNRLLKEIPFRSSLLDTLDVWDEQLAAYGNRIIEKRKEFIVNTGEMCRGIHETLTSGKEKMELEYEENVSSEDFREKLKESRERDIHTAQTNRGPHRDDFIIKANGIDLRTFGSQGQQRSAAVSLKLSEIKMIKDVTGEDPVLLLDDVLSELDGSRQESLLKEINNIQTVITGTGMDDFVKNNLSIGKKYFVKEGTVREMSLDMEE